MRAKKLLKLLNILPENEEELKQVREKAAAKVKANTEKLIALRKKVKKYGAWGFQIYMVIFWIVQSAIDMGLWPF